jgi:hypothetical protein
VLYDHTSLTRKDLKETSHGVFDGTIPTASVLMYGYEENEENHKDSFCIALDAKQGATEYQKRWHSGQVARLKWPVRTSKFSFDIMTVIVSLSLTRC